MSLDWQTHHIIEANLNRLCLMARLDVSDEQVSAALSKFGEVQAHEGIGVWNLTANDADQFCRLTEFCLSDMRYGMFTVVRKELYRIDNLLPEYDCLAVRDRDGAT